MMDIDERTDKSVSQTSLVTIPTSGTYVIQANPRRLALVIQPAVNGPISIRLGVQDTSGGLTLINPGDFPFVATLRDYGDLARRESSITGTVGDTLLISQSLCSCG